MDKRGILTRINSIFISQRRALKTKRGDSIEENKVNIQFSYLSAGKMDS